MTTKRGGLTVLSEYNDEFGGVDLTVASKHNLDDTVGDIRVRVDGNVVIVNITRTDPTRMLLDVRDHTYEEGAVT